MPQKILLDYADNRFWIKALPFEWAHQFQNMFLSRRDDGSIHELEVACLQWEKLEFTPQALDRLKIILTRFNTTNRLNKVEPIKRYDVIPNFTGTLKNYQHNAVHCLNKATFFMDQDPVGTGKTIETVAACCEHQDKTIIVSLASKIEDWIEEFEKFSTLKVNAITDKTLPKKRQQIYSQWLDPHHEAKILIISYNKMSIDHDHLVKIASSVPMRIYLDEGSQIKNPDSKVHLAACKIGNVCTHRYILNATVYRSTPVDYWAAMDFLCPGLFGTLIAFQNRHCTFWPNGAFKAERHADELVKRLKPFMIQRRKEDIEQSEGTLARKRFDNVHLVKIDSKSQTIVNKLQDKINEIDESIKRGISPSSKQHIFLINKKKSLATKQLRALISPHLLGYMHYSSIKYDKMCEIILSYKKIGVRCIVFSRWKDTIEWIKSLDPPFTYIVAHGGKDKETKQSLIKRIKTFRAGTEDVLLATDALQRGHNIPECGAVIHLDMLGNVEAFKQRNGRIDRGDLNKVLYHDYILVNSSREHRLFKKMLYHASLSDIILHGDVKLGSLHEHLEEDRNER